MDATFNRRAFLFGAAASVPVVALAPLAPSLLFANGGIVSSSPGLIGEHGPEVIVPISMDQVIAGMAAMVAVGQALDEAVRLLSEGYP